MTEWKEAGEKRRGRGRGRNVWKCNSYFYRSTSLILWEGEIADSFAVITFTCTLAELFMNDLNRGYGTGKKRLLFFFSTNNTKSKKVQKWTKTCHINVITCQRPWTQVQRPTSAKVVFRWAGGEYLSAFHAPRTSTRWPWKKHTDSGVALHWGTSEQQEKSLANSCQCLLSLFIKDLNGYCVNGCFQSCTIHLVWRVHSESATPEASALATPGVWDSPSLTESCARSTEELNLASNKRARLFIKQQMLIP